MAAVLASEPVQVDAERQARKGVPEIVYAAGKPPLLTLQAVRALLERTRSGRVLVSRASAETQALLHQELVGLRVTPSGATVLVVRVDAAPPTQTGAVIGLLTAGASDAPAADEAAFVAAEMGCRVVRADDVGVAGLHRLEAPLKRIREEQADAIIVVAGMDGALPSVVSGLVDVPVIGLPTSTGYGLGGGGVAALLSMLQTCAPGLVVVNIDNGVGAGATAALFANRVAAARRQSP
ncbi:MAG: nickel pincer cofactor biosynthesis protein LarB [Chloroflexi bacterium]|nr:nickel pincer cofactor biosynthesis protein LarB [Chloroflexota bacterium]MBV9544919.1 nickel pincer cofactor biosynthesis protein LarB [Chloroflexota bacterium]